MIKAVIFDCFGVLVTESWLAFKKRHFGDNANSFKEATKLMDQADGGIISHEEFLKKVSELSGQGAGEVEEELDTNVANEDLFEYISYSLKPKYKIGMLSNAASNWLSELFTKEQMNAFDAVSLSYEAGIIKPDPKAYENVVRKLSVAFHEAVLVDDQERHLIVARKLGMKTILYKDFSQMKRELEAILKDG